MLLGGGQCRSRRLFLFDPQQQLDRQPFGEREPRPVQDRYDGVGAAKLTSTALAVRASRIACAWLRPQQPVDQRQKRGDGQLGASAREGARTCGALVVPAGRGGQRTHQVRPGCSCAPLSMRAARSGSDNLRWRVNALRVFGMARHF